MKNILILGLLIFGLICSNAFGEDDPVLAKVGDRQIRQSELNRLISYYTPEQQAVFEQVPDNKVKLLTKVVQELVLSDDARRRGIDREEGMKEQINILINSQLASELVKREVIDKIKITDVDATIYYDLHKDDFRVPETVRARHILIKVLKRTDEDEKRTALEKTEGILKRLKAGEDFAKLATELSEDTSSKAKGGDLGFFEKAKMVPEFTKALSGLSPGDISGIVETKFGYHIIRFEEMRPARLLPFEEVKKSIYDKLMKEFKESKVSDYLDQKIKESKTEIYPERLLKPKK